MKKNDIKTDAIRIIFLCTGNSCRSQMAQGWALELANDNIEIKSAGIEAKGQNAYAIQVMSEVGIDISAQHSIRVNAEMLEWADILVTLCENAEEQCPMPSPDTVKMHLPLTDPAKIRGSEQDILAGFRITREKVRERVEFVFEQVSLDDPLEKSF